LVAEENILAPKATIVDANRKCDSKRRRSHGYNYYYRQHARRIDGTAGEKDATAWRIEGGVSVCVDSTGKQTYAILLVAQDGNTPPGKQK
jgi:hypothetical protein